MGKSSNELLYFWGRTERARVLQQKFASRLRVWGDINQYSKNQKTAQQAVFGSDHTGAQDNLWKEIVFENFFLTTVIHDANDHFVLDLWL